MGHATHFLQRLERVDGPALDLALDLYREPGLLKGALYRLNLPAGDQHIALPLEQGPEPPHALVTREGHYVTCLGAGMQPTGAHVVSHALLRTAVQELSAWRGLETREGRTQIVLGRLHRAGPRLSREDFEDLRVIAAVIPKYFVELGIEIRDRVLDFRARYRPRDYERLDEATRRRLLDYDRLSWTIGHAVLLAADAYAVEERFFPGVGVEALTHLLLRAGHFGRGGNVLRTTWAMARLGRHALPTLKEKIALFQGMGARAATDAREATLMRDALIATLALPAIAARHTPLRAEIEKYLLRMVPPTTRAELIAAPQKDHREAILIETGGNFIAEVAGLAWQTLHNDDPTQARGRTQRVAWAIMTGVDPRIDFNLLPPEFPRPTDLPESIVLPVLATLTAPIFQPEMLVGIVPIVPAVARIDAADHFLPRTLLNELTDHPHFRPDPERIRATLNDQYGHSARATPIVKPPTPGRNDPCACGSGQKYKKCCGK